MFMKERCAAVRRKTADRSRGWEIQGRKGMQRRVIRNHNSSQPPCYQFRCNRWLLAGPSRFPVHLLKSRLSPEFYVKSDAAVSLCGQHTLAAVPRTCPTYQTQLFSFLFSRFFPFATLFATSCSPSPILSSIWGVLDISPPIASRFNHILQRIQRSLVNIQEIYIYFTGYVLLPWE